jgi:hypothetical protein
MNCTTRPLLRSFARRFAWSVQNASNPRRLEGFALGVRNRLVASRFAAKESELRAHAKSQISVQNSEFCKWTITIPAGSAAFSALRGGQNGANLRQ